MDILLGINLVLSDMTMVGFEAPMSNMLDPGRPGPHDGRLSGYVVPRLALLSIVHGNEVTFVLPSCGSASPRSRSRWRLA